MPVTVGVNSYVTRADGDAYFADRLYMADWTDAEPDDQDRALLMARRALDQQAWLGSIASPDQLLAWPRMAVLDAEARAIAATVVPQRSRMLSANWPWPSFART